MCQAAFLTTLTPVALASQSYPTRPVKCVVPFAPGGGGDNIARLVLHRLGEVLQQPIVIANLPGAGGNLGSSSVARAAADGYTLLYGTNGTHAINSHLYEKTGFDAVKDFEPISRLCEMPAIVAVRSDLPVSSISDLISYSKNKKNDLSFASAGNGTTSHLAGEMFKQLTGVEWVHVPYKGGAAAMADLMAGRVDVLIDVASSVAPQLKSPRIKVLAVTSRERVGTFDNLPTVAESGVGDYVVYAWDGLFVPAKTDADIVQKLTASVFEALKNSDLKNQLESRSISPSPLAGHEFKAFIIAENKRWGGVVKKSGAKID
jgi:tripartite-type tricarboxylate transporter receptor subunit TctC